jgi:hypothetical protein
MSTLLAWLASHIGKVLFLSEPAAILTDEKRHAFDGVFQFMREAPSGAQTSYACPYPKWEYLRYLVRCKDVVLHGSSRHDIEVLEPKQQTDYSGKRISAVFASRDPIWPMFFAILNLRGYRGSLRNGCWVVQGKDRAQRFYFFSVNREFLGHWLWTEGMIYILPGETFAMTGRGTVRFDEWASEATVTPLAKLAVKPDDFRFLGQVAGHQEGESMLRSWLMYKKRRGTSAGGGN